MKKLLYALMFSISLLISSCGTSEIVIPEGTKPEVAEVMQKYRLSSKNAEALLNAFNNQSGFANSSIDDVASVFQTSINGRRVLAVNISGRNTMYINLD